MPTPSYIAPTPARVSGQSGQINDLNAVFGQVAALTTVAQASVSFLNPVARTASATLLATDLGSSQVFTGGTSLTLTLPTMVAQFYGQTISIRVAPTSTVTHTLATSGTDLIDGVASLSLQRSEFVILVADVTGWVKTGASTLALGVAITAANTAITAATTVGTANTTAIATANTAITATNTQVSSLSGSLTTLTNRVSTDETNSAAVTASTNATLAAFPTGSPTDLFQAIFSSGPFYNPGVDQLSVSRGGTFGFEPRNISGSAPFVSAAPVVSGTPALGATLTCSTGTWSNTPTSYLYAWRRGYATIFGANAATYVLTAADAGINISCTVLAVNGSGTANASPSSNNLRF